MPSSALSLTIEMQRSRARTAKRTSWGRSAGAVLAFALIVVLVGCSPGEMESPAPTTTSATNGTTTQSPLPEPTQEEVLEDTMPTDFFSLGAGADAVFRDGDVTGLELQEVLIEGDEDGQRVTVNFTRSGGASESDEIELWAAPVEQARHEGTGEAIPMDGQFLLQISIPGAWPQHDSPPPDVTVPRGGIVEDVAMTGAFAGFESGGALYLGLGTTEAEYRLTSGSDPYHVVIDIRSGTAG